MGASEYEKSPYTSSIGSGGNRGKRLSTEEILRINNSHNRYNGSPYLAAKCLPHSRDTIASCWKRAGFEIRSTRS